jgi:Mg2+/citrate symporter
MKKISITALISFIAFGAQAQENFNPFKDRDFLFDALHICTMLIAIYLISSFILQAIKAAMTARIKNRILDKGAEENIVRELLRPEKKDNKKEILQWFFMLVAVGIGLLLIKIIMPFGIHSLAILALSIAAGFGGYYYFSRQTDKE